MAIATANGIEGLRELQGETVGPSDWREVTQEMINDFAALSGDDQWIHVDVERAKSESPFGTTIAHGNLTLALIDGLRKGLTEWSGSKLGVNYGWNKVRFPAPVLAGARVANDVRLSLAEPEDARGQKAGVHARDDHRGARGGDRQVALVERGRVLAVFLHQLIDRGHARSFSRRQVGCVA